MASTKIVENEYATLIYHDESKIVHHQFHKPIAGEPLRTLLMKGIDLLKEHGAIKWLSDDRNNSALPPDDTDWGNNVWFPSAKAAGWKFWALVVPDDMLARINMSEFVFRYSQEGVRVAVFTDPKKALKWLETVESTEVKA